MQVLYFFESIRTPILDIIMNGITQCGYEIVFLLFALLIYWCVDKKRGYYILMVGFWGLEINQLLKMMFRIPRPWVRDPNFTIVESAREAAGGYSFPSGHSQISTGLYGCLAKTSKGLIKRISIILLVLVPISRMYLGAHTPMDVGTSVVVGLLLVYIIYWILYGHDQEKRILIQFICMFVFAIGTVIYISMIDASKVDAENLADAVKTSYTVLGALIAMIGCYYLEKRYINFSTDAPVIWQVAKLVIGFTGVFAIRIVLKKFLVYTPFSSGICDMLRYMMMVFFAMIVWPAVFSKCVKAESDML